MMGIGGQFMKGIKKYTERFKDTLANILLGDDIERVIKEVNSKATFVEKVSKNKDYLEKSHPKLILSEDRLATYERNYKVSTANIKNYYKNLQDIFKQEGFDNAKVNFGIELEFYKKAGEEYFWRRSDLMRLQNAMQKFIDVEYKHEQHMPFLAHTSAMNRMFAINEKKYYSSENRKAEKDKYLKTKSSVEPLAGLGQLLFNRAEKDPESGHWVRASKPDLYGLSQGELEFHPSSPLAAPNLLNVGAQKLIYNAKSLGLEEIVLTTSGPNMSPNSVHWNVSLMTFDKSNNPLHNLFQKGAYNDELSNDGSNAKDLSDFALIFSAVRNNFIKNGGAYLFASTRDCYRRFNKSEPSGPNHLGFFSRREYSNNGGCAWRGDGIVFSRINSEKPDNGPRRFEERASGICWHPNIELYPEQKNTNYEFVELYMKMLNIAAEAWQERRHAIARGDAVEELHVNDLYKKESHINAPKNFHDAKEQFLNSTLMKMTFGNRRNDMVEARARVGEIIAKKDLSPRTPKEYSGHAF
jgi:hypothetical protein